MKRNKVLSLLGLATRAGKIKSGSFLTEQAVKAGKAYLVLIAGDASENTKKKLSNMCSFYEVPAQILRRSGYPWPCNREGIPCQRHGDGCGICRRD